MINKRIGVFDCINIILLLVTGIVMLFPFWNVVMTSFVSGQEFYSRPFILWPREFVLDSYQMIFRNNQIIDAIMVTVFVTVIGTLYSMLMTTSLSYGMSIPQFPGKKFFMILIVMTMYINAGLIPYYLLVRNLGMINSIWVMIIPYAISVWSFIVIRSFMRQLPDSLRESAMLDGGNELQIYIRIILPLSLPALAAFTLFYAVDYWNTWWAATLFITDRRYHPLQYILREMVIRGVRPVAEVVGRGSAFYDTGVKMATVVVATVPILCVYPFLQKYFVTGITLGAIKG